MRIKAKEYLNNGLNVKEVAAKMKVSKATLYKAFNIKKIIHKLL